MKGLLTTIEFGCHDCDAFGGMSRNGMGLASQHAKRYGHRTWVEAVYEFSGSASIRTATSDVEAELPVRIREFPRSAA